MRLKKPATLLKVMLVHVCFSSFLYHTNGTKFRKASQMVNIQNQHGLSHHLVIISQ